MFRKAILLLTASAMLVYVSCKPTEVDPSTKYGTLKAQFSSESFDVEAGGTISLPFAVTGVEGSELELEAQTSSQDSKVVVKADIYYQGTVDFTAPAVTSGETIKVTLNVVDASHKRNAKAETQVVVASSEPLGVSLVSDVRSIAIRPSGSFQLPFTVSGSDKVEVAEAVKFDLSAGFNASCKWNADKKGGVVTVTAPASLPSSLKFKMTISDDHSRTAVLEKDITIVTVSETAGAANCYIVKPGATLSIPAVEGNSADKLTFDNARLVWQDELAMVKSVSAGADEGVVIVQLNAGKSGNAVVAAEKEGVIVWSWHVWVCDFDPESSAMSWTSSATGTTYTFMDRDLGALSGEKYSPDAIGLLYQWGRKDPFVGAEGVLSSVYTKKYDIDGNILREVSQERPTYPETDYTSTNLQLSIQNPHIFYHAPSKAWPVVDWLTDDAQRQNNDAWGAVSGVKTKYDPCPEGWEVPKHGDPWGFRQQYNKSGKLNDTGKYDPEYPWYIEYEDEYCIGFRYKTPDGKEFWFPFSGKKDCNTGDLSSVGGGSQYHTRDTQNTTCQEELLAWGNPASESQLNRSYGSSIRCIKVTK